MAADVTFEAIRKSDYVPFASFYLGGNRTARTVRDSNKSTLIINEIELTSLGNWKEAIDYLIEIEDSLYLGHHGEKAIEFIETWQDQMAYFIRVA